MPFAMPVKVVCPHCQEKYTIKLDLETLRHGSKPFTHRVFWCGETVRWNGNDLVKGQPDE